MQKKKKKTFHCQHFSVSYLCLDLFSEEGLFAHNEENIS